MTYSICTACHHDGALAGGCIARHKEWNIDTCDFCKHMARCTRECDTYVVPADVKREMVNLMSKPSDDKPDYDISIHDNPDAAAWAKLFIEKWSKVYPDRPAPDEGWMLGWFANAMMAMHDHVKRQESTNAK